LPWRWVRLGKPRAPNEALRNGGALSEAEAWIDFYVTAGASAAVLIGLLFVGLSINREKIAAHPVLGGQARQALFALVSIFVLSLIMLIPEQSSEALGAELLAAALVNLGLAVPRQVRRMKATGPTDRRTFALLIAVFDGALLLVVAAGVSLLGDSDFALSLLAPAVIAFALLAIFNSWKLTLLGT
jgi:hypothetical protein